MFPYWCRPGATLPIEAVRMLNKIRFILDGEVVTVNNAEPTQSVLQYLREDLHRTGSKEGCAEGDCGACTIVIAEVINNQVQFKATNACIQFLPTLHGKALFTVESLKQADGSLHPVQQSMVDYHGSQCGFCTPGFIMSLFARYQDDTPVNRENLENILSGNLCRCTGYKPIIEAGMHMQNYSTIKDHQINSAQLLNQLNTLSSDQTISLQEGQYYAPTSLQTLADLYLQHPEATILAGGTDVGLWVTKQLHNLNPVIYLGNVTELKNITTTSDDIEIAAAVSLEDAFACLSKPYPELSELFRRFASMPIRHVGTLVGNIANGSPIGDSMPALICIGARIKLRRGSQTRELALQDLYIDYQKNVMLPGEFIESVLIPERDAHLKLKSYKLSKRFDQDISAVCAAFSMRLDGDRVKHITIAYGGMAAIPKRAVITENFILGKPWSEDTVRQSMALLTQDYTPLTDMRASANYREQSAAHLLYRFYLESRPKNPLPSDQVNVFEAHI